MVVYRKVKYCYILLNVYGIEWLYFKLKYSNFFYFGVNFFILRKSIYCFIVMFGK